MFASILIILISTVLLVYWFRYSCLLVLRNRTEDVAAMAVADSRFHIAEVKAGLLSDTELDPLHASLQRDYAVLTYLLEHAVGLELHSIEDRLLVVDYKVMHWWYRVVRTAAPDQARQALTEMAGVLAALVGGLNRRAGLQNEV